MKNSLYLGRVAGIGIYIHWTFLILVAWVLIVYYRRNHDMMEAISGLAFVLTIFGCVVLHELGHALTAKRYGIRTRNITLLPIGGVANLERMPEKPIQEFVVAIAGPLVNVVIAFILGIWLSLSGGFLVLQDPASLETLNPDNMLIHLFIANVVLVLFNLIPAFPMDGGRMLRALLATRIDRVTATRIAAGIGKLLAIGFVFLGIFYDFWLVFIGIFVYLGAEGESSYVMTRHALTGVKVRDVIMKDFKILYPHEPISKAVDLLLNSQDREFLVMDVNGREPFGTLTRNDIIKALAEHGPGYPVKDACSKKVLLLTPDMDIGEVMHKMLSENIPLAAVYEDGRLLGVVDQENISEMVMIRNSLRQSAEESFV